MDLVVGNDDNATHHIMNDYVKHTCDDCAASFLSIIKTTFLCTSRLVNKLRKFIRFGSAAGINRWYLIRCDWITFS